MRRTLLRRAWGRYGLRGGSLTARAAVHCWLSSVCGSCSPPSASSLWLRFAWFPSAAYVVREFAERGGVGVCW
ncbi:hypothetical protein [Streptomyces malaysiensis]|uniref:hypothetical protein n=1 Tax=Streptomyces malaysiensis TaxID=92644 RepID=UPI0011CDA904|nr:hypothetical protein [Streptomyces malaysiensis]